MEACRELGELKTSSKVSTEEHLGAANRKEESE